MKKKISKSIRKQLFAMVAERYISAIEDTGYTNVVDVLGYNSDLYPWEIVGRVVEYADDWCANGHFSRWTSFGCSLVHEAEDFAKALLKEYKRLFPWVN